MRLDIVYGLSGAGKTTLCKNIKDAFFINLGNNKEFGKKSMIEIFQEEFKKNSHYNYYITEACLYDFNYRNKFVEEISNYIKATDINVFYINIEKEELWDFSKQKLDRFKKYENDLFKIKVGCDHGNHYIIYEKILSERINKIQNTIA